MEDHQTSMLAYATAAPGPLRFEIRTSDGNRIEREFASSYIVIGRGPGSDLQLTEKTVSFRHAYIQVIGQRVAYVDLLSVAGVQVSGPPFHGWLSTEHEISIGSTKLRLLGDHWDYDEALPSPLDFRPRDEARIEYGVLPHVDLELLNTAHQGVRWPINRVITLVGRDDRCRITVADDRLSRVQCALLLLPSGLWGVDVLGKGGVQFDDHVSNCGLLATGTVLQLGPYQLTPHYLSAPPAQTIAPAYAVQEQVEFVTRSNRVFPTDFYHNTVIVYPQGDSQVFFFKDVHVEASRVSDLFQQKKFHNLVIDFSRVEQMPHTVPDGLTSICRMVPGRVAQCGLRPETISQIQSSPVLRSVPAYGSLPEALQAIYTMA